MVLANGSRLVAHQRGSVSSQSRNMCAPPRLGRPRRTVLYYCARDDGPVLPTPGPHWTPGASNGSLRRERWPRENRGPPPWDHHTMCHELPDGNGSSTMRRSGPAFIRTVTATTCSQTAAWRWSFLPTDIAPLPARLCLWSHCALWPVLSTSSCLISYQLQSIRAWVSRRRLVPTTYTAQTLTQWCVPKHHKKKEPHPPRPPCIALGSLQLPRGPTGHIET